MSKQKIREWLENNCNTENIVDIIDQYTKDQSAWVSVDIDPKETCTAWYAKQGQIVGLFRFYICPEYGNGQWIDCSDEEDVILKGGHYMIIDEPLPPTQEG